MDASRRRPFFGVLQASKQEVGVEGVLKKGSLLDFDWL